MTLGILEVLYILSVLLKCVCCCDSGNMTRAQRERAVVLVVVVAVVGDSSDRLVSFSHASSNAFTERSL